MELKSLFIKSLALGSLLITGSQMSASAQGVGTPTVERFGTRIYEKNGLESIKADIRENQRLMQAGRSKELRNGVPGNVTFNWATMRMYWGAPRSAKELEKYRGIATKLNTTPQELLAQFTARANYFFLTFDDFLLGQVIASNLKATRPDITADVLLDGLRQRKSFTRTMRNLGLGLEEAKAIEKTARQEIKESKR
jgi:hypothetical protein